MKKMMTEVPSLHILKLSDICNLNHLLELKPYGWDNDRWFFVINFPIRFYDLIRISEWKPKSKQIKIGTKMTESAYLTLFETRKNTHNIGKCLKHVYFEFVIFWVNISGFHLGKEEKSFLSVNHKLKATFLVQNAQRM